MRKRNAQGMVEFALVAPILLMLLFASIDFGWLIFNYGQLYNGLREALRFGSVSGYTTTKQYDDCAGMRAKIKGYAGFSGVNDSNITINYDNGAAPSIGTNYSPDCSGTTSTFDPTTLLGARVRIKVDVPVHFLTPFFNGMFKSGFQITLEAGRTISGFA
jgi:Flp pilus assembly protein TadG